MSVTIFPRAVAIALMWLSSIHGASATKTCLSDQAKPQSVEGQLTIKAIREPRGSIGRHFILKLARPVCLSSQEPDDAVRSTRTIHVFAQDDHIIPPVTSQALKDKIGTDDYTELGLPGGHVGVFVGGKAQKLLGSGIADWLGARG